MPWIGLNTTRNFASIARPHADTSRVGETHIDQYDLNRCTARRARTGSAHNPYLRLCPVRNPSSWCLAPSNILQWASLPPPVILPCRTRISSPALYVRSPNSAAQRTGGVLKKQKSDAQIIEMRCQTLPDDGGSKLCPEMCIRRVRG